MDLSLIIMAAGIGSRYGRLKQLEPVSPSNQTLIEYSIYDALNAGFNHFTFIIRRELESQFEDAIISKISHPNFKFTIVYQELSSCLPSDTQMSPDRTKPWGTGHAVLCAKNAVRSPFAVINADDYYGPQAYKILADFLSNNPSDNFALVGYELKKTLSEHGSVSRGLCATDTHGSLLSVTEHSKIAKDEMGNLITWNANGQSAPLIGNEITSLNLWGLTPSFFPFLEKQFHAFIKANASDPKAEFYLPKAINDAILENVAQVSVLNTSESWVGMTYEDDLARVKNLIAQKIVEGAYPQRLWQHAHV